MKMTSIEVAVRAAETLCRHETMDISDFCSHTDTYFQECIEELKRRVAQEPKPNPDDEDEVYGYEMWTGDRFLELKHHRNHSGYFGALMVFSALERFLQSLYDITLDVAIVPKFRDAILEIGQKRLTLEHFKDFLKRFDIEVSGTPYHWVELIKLQRYRNAIVHQGGRVTETNCRLLSAYNHKTGEVLDIRLKYVQQAARLVQEAVKRIGEDYVKALKKRGL